MLFFEAIIASLFPAPEVLVHTGVTLFSRRPSECKSGIGPQTSDFGPQTVHRAILSRGAEV
jgi:hypothetical protein